MDQNHVQKMGNSCSYGHSDNSGGGTHLPTAAVRYRCAPRSDVPLRIYGLGTVSARVLTVWSFEVGAALLSLSADLGDHVAKDQELAKLHPAEQEARVARAEAAIDANAAALLKAKAGVEEARAVLAEREVANKRLQDLARKDVASVQRAEEAQALTRMWLR